MAWPFKCCVTNKAQSVNIISASPSTIRTIFSYSAGQKYVSLSLNEIRWLHTEVMDSFWHGFPFSPVCQFGWERLHHSFFSRSKGGLFPQGTGVTSSPHVSSLSTISLSVRVSPGKIFSQEDFSSFVKDYNFPYELERLESNTVVGREGRGSFPPSLLPCSLSCPPGQN